MELPERIHILGYNGDMLSIIFERLKILGFNGEIIIIPNIGKCDDVPFENGLEYSIADFNNKIDVSGESCVFSISSPSAKIAVFKDFRQKHNVLHDNYLTFIDPSVIIAETANIKQGTNIQPGSIVSPYARIGFGVTISRNSSIGHHCELEDFVRINPGVNMGGHCNIGFGSTIGIGATVFDSVTIGKNSVIGGGSVVTRDIPEGVLAYGNPCKVIRPNINFEKYDE